MIVSVTLYICIVTVTWRDRMIDVLIPETSKASADGVAFADEPSISEYEVSETFHVRENCMVRIVPPAALQALLRQGQSFALFEKRFGQVSKSQKASILALFSLIEEERTWDQDKRLDFIRWTLVKRRAQQDEAKVKRSPEEDDGMARSLAEHDRAWVDKRGRLRTITDQLNGLGTLRLWRDKHTDSLSVGVLAEDFLDALLILLLLNLGNAESVAVCGWCGKRFTRTKTNMDFCSLRCGNNARKARQRAKHKEIRNGSRKAR
jgi:hypothetical protein